MKKIHYHLVGVGGVAMSGLAEILRAQGHIVTGSDLKTTGHRVENIKGANRVVYSPAVTPGSPGWIEVEAARKKDVETLRYDDLLGELVEDKRLIAIAGMHGKSTTTAMVASVLEDAGFDPTVLVGAQVNKWRGRNWRVGQSNIWVLEADEYEKKFLTLYPEIAIVTNVEAEHLDVFGSLKGVRETFIRFLNQIKNNGTIIACRESPVLQKVMEKVEKKNKTIIYYGKTGKYSSQILPELKLIGEHNILNALAALAVADTLKINRKVSLKSLKNFTGIGRRLEIVGEKNGITVIDDYGHHPTEIKASLQALREHYPKKRLIVAFQPHQHHRTHVLFEDFAQSFNQADQVLVLDVFTVPGRDREMFVDSRDLVKSIQAHEVDAYYVGSLEDLKKDLDQYLKSGDIFLTIGATDITKIGREWLLKEQKLKIKNQKNN